MFDKNQPYASIKEPGDSSRTLLVQGDEALWEGWPPTDTFPTPDWAKKPAETAQVPLNFEDRVEAAQSKMSGMKHKLAEASRPQPGEVNTPPSVAPEPQPLKKKT